MVFSNAKLTLGHRFSANIVFIALAVPVQAAFEVHIADLFVVVARIVADVVRIATFFHFANRQILAVYVQTKGTATIALGYMITIWFWWSTYKAYLYRIFAEKKSFKNKFHLYHVIKVSLFIQCAIFYCVILCVWINC